METAQHVAGIYGWQLLAIVVVIAVAILIRRYGRMLERQTRERSERL